MKLVYCSANIYLLLYISHFLLIISCRHLKHTADKCTCAWEFKKPFIFCFITLRCIQAKINEQFTYKGKIPKIVENQKKSSKIKVYTKASKKGKNKQTNKETDNLNGRVKVSTECRLQFTSTEQYICLKRGGF